MRHLLLTITGLFFLCLQGFAQHHHESTAMETQLVPRFRVAAVIGHTYVPAIAGTEHFFIPSWGLDLEYWFNESWAIGLHNDIELQTFLVETNEGEFLERDYPIVLTLDAIFKPWKGLVFQFGPGYELEKTEDFILLRFGVEYEIEFGHHWDIAPMVFYDTRFEANDTWSVGMGIGKRF